MSAPVAEIWKQTTVVDEYLSRRQAIPLAREQVELMLELLGSGELPVGSFLDLGCGDGILGAAVLERFPESRGVLLDFSAPMLEQARSLLSRFGDRLDYRLADYAQPGWTRQLSSTAPFDAVVSGYSIHHQPDSRKRSLYAEIYSLLKPGGWFINLEHVAPAAAVTTRLFEDRFIDHACAAEAGNSGGRTRAQIAEAFHQRPDKAANILAPVEVQCAWLRELGFHEVDCFFKFHELAVFGGQRPVHPSY